MHTRRSGGSLLAATACAAMWSLATTDATADTYPAKPIHLVVGFSAGGPTDVVARAFAEYASRTLHQPVIVENRPGANTVLAAEAVASARPDGYTLLLGATNHTMIPGLYKDRVKFDAEKSFLPICTLAVSPTVLVVGPSMKVESLDAFLQNVKAAPGRRTFGSAGVGSSGQFAGERFERMTHTAMNHIPYKGAAPAITDLIAGQLDSSFATLGSILPLAQSNKLTPIAVAAAQRSALLPNVPTFDEAGVRGFRDSAWYGVLAPAGTPPEAVRVLTQTARGFVQWPATGDKFRGLGLDAQSTCGADFGLQVHAEVQANTQLAKDLNLKLD